MVTTAAAAISRLDRHPNSPINTASSGISAIWPAVLPDVAIPVARPRLRSKLAATVVDTSDGEMAAKPVPPMMPMNSTSCQGSDMNAASPTPSAASAMPIA